LTEAKAHFRFGSFRDTEREARAAISLLPRGGPSWFEAGRLLVNAYPQLREFESCEEIAEQLLSNEPTADALPSAIGAWAIAAKSLFDLGRAELAGGFIARLERLSASGLLSPMLYAWLPHTLATQALYEGRFGDFLQHRKDALEGFLRVDDRYYSNNNKISVGYGYFLLGMYEEAERSLRQALDETQLEYPTLYRSAKHNLGLTLAYLGKHQEGYQLEEEARQLSAENGAIMSVSWCYAYAAQILFLGGDLLRAKQAAESALSLMEAENPPKPYTLAVLSRILLGLQDTKAARQLSTQALSLMNRLQHIDEGESLIRLSYIEALFAHGETQLAAQEIQSAQQKILQVAAQISNPIWRKSFVRNVPENVVILSMAKR
jgi:tetratricopeptide (TPR) repeat protein